MDIKNGPAFPDIRDNFGGQGVICRVKLALECKLIVQCSIDTFYIPYLFRHSIQNSGSIKLSHPANSKWPPIAHRQTDVHNPDNETRIL